MLHVPYAVKNYNNFNNFNYGDARPWRVACSDAEEYWPKHFVNAESLSSDVAIASNNLSISSKC